ncbi:hypothetical protein RJ639_018501 [Escallonia herrerae]|uniref:F-box domain-containing protein n=1 Tax=Escallonia herrerae TaxID=1293975 RepID=A0AA89AIJ3_9ASTE|nr:hypothetical protein RJ639_018501 [Escallonia herrerae]
MADFPLDILIDILSRLPAASLILSKSVSRQWRSIISRDPHLLNLHHSRQSPHLIAFGPRGTILSVDHEVSCRNPDKFIAVKKINPPDFNLAAVGHPSSIDGLLLICNLSFKNCVFLWNPSINEFLEIGTPFGQTSFSIDGIYCDAVNDDYKDKFEEVAAPDFSDQHKECPLLTMGLAVLKGLLCVYWHGKCEVLSSLCALKVYAMMDYGARESWTELVVVPFVYNPEGRKIRNLHNALRGISGLKATTYVETLISPRLSAEDENDIKPVEEEWKLGVQRGAAIAGLAAEATDSSGRSANWRRGAAIAGLAAEAAAAITAELAKRSRRAALQQDSSRRSAQMGLGRCDGGESSTGGDGLCDGEVRV